MCRGNQNIFTVFIIPCAKLKVFMESDISICNTNFAKSTI